MAKTHPILADLLKLSKKDRAQLAQALIASLDHGAADSDADTIWGDEIARRMKSIEDGSGELIDGAEVRRRVRERLQAIRKAR